MVCASTTLLLTLKSANMLYLVLVIIKLCTPLCSNNSPIELVSSFKYLGVYLDQHITWSDHVLYLC